jgi:hypothetical protein
MFQQVVNQRWRMLNHKTKMSNHSMDRVVGDVAQSLIKGPTLTSKGSPCFIVPLIVKMDSSSIKVHALLDFEAFVCFMDKDFVDHHKLPSLQRNIISS